MTARIPEAYQWLLVPMQSSPQGAMEWQAIRVSGQDALAVRFGPLPLFFTRIPYDKIRSVEPGQTTLLDGWGIHYLPGRGTTFNIWGFHCVRIELESRTLRIGTDDVENLTQFLHQRMCSTADGGRGDRDGSF